MKKNKTFLHKIEIDEKSGEPKIVEVPVKNKDKLIEEEFVPQVEGLPLPDKSQGEQLIMNKILGYDKQSDINKRQKIFKNVTTTIFVILVVAVLAFTAYHDFFSKAPPSFDQIFEMVIKNWYYLIFAIICLFLCYFLKGLKLSVMCKSVTSKWHFKTCFETGIIGHYYNYVTPLACGGQPFEIYHLSKNGVTGGAAASLPIAAFFMQQLAFFIMAILAVVFYGTNTFNIPTEIIGHMPTVITVLATVGLIFSFFMPALVVGFSLFPRLGKALVKFVMFLGNKLRIVKDPVNTTAKVMTNVETNAKCLKAMAYRPIVFITTFLISIGEQLALCSIAYFTLRGFGFDWASSNIKEWAQVIQLCIMLYAAISFIPTPGNAGAADLSFYLLFDAGLAIGTSKIAGLAFPAMMLWRFLSFYSFIIIGFIFTTTHRKKSQK